MGVLESGTFHHTCIAYSSRDALRDAKADLTRQGRELVQSGTWASSASPATSTSPRPARCSSSST